MPKITKQGGASIEPLAPPEPRAPLAQASVPAPEATAQPTTVRPRLVAPTATAPASGALGAPSVARRGVGTARPVSEDPRKAGK